MLMLGNFGMRSCRGLLFPRQCVGETLITQPSCGLKKSLEEKLGLPPRPKKPLSAYFRFMLQLRPSLKQKYPQAKTTELVKLLAAEWAKADPALREELKNQYEKDIAVYSEEFIKYQNKLTPFQRTTLLDARHEMRHQKEKKQLRKKMEEMGKPKRPLSPYLKFTNAQKRGDLPFKEWQQKMSEMWHTMPDEEKQHYLDITQQEMKDYQKRLQEWEEKMIRLGHTDIVRQEAIIEPLDDSWESSSKKHGTPTRE